MARANRHHIPGQVWHITHRCHKKEFLLKFARDRKRWLQWLFEAKKRCGLNIFNHTITSNHVHLLVVEGEAVDSERFVNDVLEKLERRSGIKYMSVLTVLFHGVFAPNSQHRAWVTLAKRGKGQKKQGIRHSLKLF